MQNGTSRSRVRPRTSVQRVPHDAKVIERGMGKLRTAGAVAHCPHAGSGRFEAIVDDKVSARVQLDACQLDSETRGVGYPPGGNQ